MTPFPAWFFWALMAAVAASATAIFAKAGIQNVNSDMATLIRTAMILLCLLLYVPLTGQWSGLAGVSRRTWLFLGLSAVATGISWVCYFRALQLGKASQVAPVDKLSVVLVAVFAVIFLGERPSLRDWSGIMLVAAGVLMLALRR